MVQASSSTVIADQLNSGSTGSSGLFTGLPAGQYIVTVDYATVCKQDTSVAIIQPDAIQAVAVTTPALCDYGQLGNGTANIVATGGVPPYRYTWSTGDTAHSISGLAEGNYLVLVHDNHNCIDSAIAAVEYDNCCKPFLPTAFTLNNDGENDVFKIIYKGDLKVERFSIYNRFGQVIYSETDANKGWDGTLMESKWMQALITT